MQGGKLIKRISFFVLLLVAVTFIFQRNSAIAEKYELKLAHFVPAPHFFSKHLDNWAKELEKNPAADWRLGSSPGLRSGCQGRSIEEMTFY